MLDACSWIDDRHIEKKSNARFALPGPPNSGRDDRRTKNWRQLPDPAIRRRLEALAFQIQKDESAQDQPHIAKQFVEAPLAPLGES